MSRTDWLLVGPYIKTRSHAADLPLTDPSSAGQFGGLLFLFIFDQEVTDPTPGTPNCAEKPKAVDPTTIFSIPIRNNRIRTIFCRSISPTVCPCSPCCCSPGSRCGVETSSESRCGNLSAVLICSSPQPGRKSDSGHSVFLAPQAGVGSPLLGTAFWASTRTSSP